MSGTDEIGLTSQDYLNLRDGFIRYMCLLIREKDRKSFKAYELFLGCQMRGYYGNLDELKRGILENKGIYQVMIDRIMKLLLDEDYLVPTDDPYDFVVTKKLREHCKGKPES